MTIRERMEQQEHLILSEYACFSDSTKGRDHPQPESDTRTCFQRDTDRILHSKSFRRLMHKTQVFLKPEGDHYRTRLTHTLEVTHIARSIARGLQLNEDLTEAMAMGHDLGHTPFGHAGEVALTEVLGEPFNHNEQSLRVVDVLENNGEGLNLTYETRMGILGHTWGARDPETLEGMVLRYADRIAYMNHDIDDAMRGNILTEADIPKSVVNVLGQTHSERINTMVEDIILASQGKNQITMHAPVEQAMNELRQFMFDSVYHNPIAKAEESKGREIIKQLFDFYMKHPEKLPEGYAAQLDFDGLPRAVCDYIAGMTDKYAISKFSEIYIPLGWQIR